MIPSNAVATSSLIYGSLRSQLLRPTGWFRRVLQEPLLHFFLVGLLLFVAGEYYKAATNANRIIVTNDRVAKLVTDYHRQFGAEPSASTVTDLVDNYVDEEVLFRAGLALRLDRDDEIVRRRVVQKMQFLEQDLQPPSEPTDAQILEFYAANRARYAIPERVTFSHIFFSPDRGGDEAARVRAEKVLASLSDQTIRAPEQGDNFPDLYDYAKFGPDQARRLFGDTPVAQMLFSAPAGHWSGPYRSGYGWHLIYLQSRQSQQLPPLSEIRDQVRADTVTQAREIANRERFTALKARFTIVREGRGALP